MFKSARIAHKVRQCAYAADGHLQPNVYKRSEWDALGFGAKIAALEASGALRVGSIAPDRLYANSPEPDGTMCLVWRV